MNPAPVGIFDSGVGGLSVAREIRTLLPSESLLYLADSAYCPYGGRPVEEVRSRSRAATGELIARGAKAVVIACNTATGAALEMLREEFPVPILGLEPAVKPAAASTRVGRIGVMATAGTLKSERFARLVSTFASDVEVYPVACSGLVELVEEGENDGERAISKLTELMSPLKEAKVDTVVLGCSHYPFLKHALGVVMGPSVRLIDSGRAVARHLERVLKEVDGLTDPAETPAAFHMLTTGEPAAVGVVAARLWGRPVFPDHIDLRAG